MENPDTNWDFIDKMNFLIGQLCYTGGELAVQCESMDIETFFGDAPLDATTEAIKEEIEIVEDNVERIQTLYADFLETLKELTALCKEYKGEDILKKGDLKTKVYNVSATQALNTTEIKGKFKVCLPAPSGLTGAQLDSFLSHLPYYIEEVILNMLGLNDETKKDEEVKKESEKQLQEKSEQEQLEIEDVLKKARQLMEQVQNSDKSFNSVYEGYGILCEIMDGIKKRYNHLSYNFESLWSGTGMNAGLPNITITKNAVDDLKYDISFLMDDLLCLWADCIMLDNYLDYHSDAASQTFGLPYPGYQEL